MHLPIERQAVSADPDITTTITPSVSATAKSTSILAEAAASADLSWWQLLCIVLGGVLALGVGVWAWWRHRKKVKADKQVEKNLEKEEREKKLAELVEATKKRAAAESDSDSESESEDYDSVSDGGTIRPRRGRGSRRRKRRGRDWSDSEDSDDSYDRRRRRRKGRRDDYDRRRDRRREKERRSRSPETPPSPSLPLPPSKSKKRETFRDSVFSSYGSMKKAAVRLKYVEAKAKLKKELEKEESIEQARQMKIKEANAEIQREREWEAMRRDDTAHSSGSGQPLIPPVRPGTGHSSDHTAVLPTPPPRAARRQETEDSYMTHRKPPSARLQPQTDLRGRPRQETQPLPQQYPPRQGSKALDDEITQLLGSQSKPKPKPSPKSKPTYPVQPPTNIPYPVQNPIAAPSHPANSFQDDWLSRPDPALSFPQSPRAESVYLSIPRPQDRPTIPKGGLAPAPPGKARITAGTGAGSLHGSARSELGTAGVNGSKWASRLRERR